ncbi:MAG TPA: hypothetical protein VLB80_02020 [Candidatus Babeliales bacterium]|nr:hypothetical protein [Candidatus Babeliales bacterium]
MKKIISTALTAVVLTIAVVSNIDARARSASAPVTKREAKKDLIESTKEVDKAVTLEEKRMLADELLQKIAASPEARAKAQIQIDILDKDQEIKVKESEIATASADLGFFHFSLFDSAELRKLKIDLAQLKKERADLEVSIGTKKDSSYIKWAVGTAIAVLGTLAVSDALGYTQAYPTASQGGWVGRGLSYGGEKLSPAYESAKSVVRSGYEKLPNIPYYGKQAVAERAAEERARKLQADQATLVNPQ